MSNVDFDDQDTPEVEQEVPESVVEDEDGAEGESEDVEASTEDDGEEEVAEAAPPRRSRENDRIRSLRERAQAEKDRADRLEREISEARARDYAQSRQRETQAERTERLALMSPEERSEFKLNEAMENNRREMAAMQFRMEDQTDRSAFHAKASVDPFYAKWADKVEAKRQEFLKQGTVVPREELLKWMVGESVIANRGRTTAKAVKQGQENIRRQQTRAVNGKADTASQRSRAADSPAKRLEGVPI